MRTVRDSFKRESVVMAFLVFSLQPYEMLVRSQVDTVEEGRRVARQAASAADRDHSRCTLWRAYANLTVNGKSHKFCGFQKRSHS